MRSASNYFELFLIIVYAISACVSISAFASLVGVPVDISSSKLELKNYAITAEIKMHKSIIKKKRKKHDKIMLLAKRKLNKI